MSEARETLEETLRRLKQERGEKVRPRALAEQIVDLGNRSFSVTRVPDDSRSLIEAQCLVGT